MDFKRFAITDFLLPTGRHREAGRAGKKTNAADDNLKQPTRMASTPSTLRRRARNNPV